MLPVNNTAIQQSLKKRLSQGSFWVLIGKLLTSCLGFVVTLLLAQLLTPKEVGQYFLLFSLVSIMTTLALFGLPTTVVKLISESLALNLPRNAKYIVKLICYISAINISFTLVIIAIFFTFITEHLAFALEVLVIILAVAWLTLFSFQQILAEIYRGYQKLIHATLFSGLFTSMATSLTLFIFWLVNLDTELKDVMLITVVSILISVLVSASILWKKLNPIPEQKENITIASISSVAWPIGVTSLLLLLISQADLWLVGIFLSSEDVAIYGMMSRLIIFSSLPLLVVNSVISPIIPELFSLSKLKILEKTVRLSATVAILPSVLFFIIIISVGEELLSFFWGESYIEGVEVLIILSIGQLVNVMAGSCGLTLMHTGHQKLMMYITTITGVLTILLSLKLVHSDGINGVAMASATGLITQNLLMLCATRYKVGIWTFIHPTLLIREITQKHAN